MATQMSDKAVLVATGRDWGQWREALDAIGAAKMTHTEIAARLHADGTPGWWSQMVTVEYERMIGRRQPMQRCDGAFSASASRTLAGHGMDAALARWCEIVDGMAEFGGVLATSEPRTTASGNWRYWRIDLEDGSKVSVNFSEKGGGKTAVAVNHDKLPDADSVERSKAVWKGLLAAL